MKIKNKTIVSLASFAALAFFTSAASAQHVDVRPYVAEGKIVTGGFDDATSTFTPVIRAYGYDFGEDAGNPYFLGDPGFNAPAGSGLTPGSELGFNILGSLIYWNGVGDPSSFGATPADEALRLSFGNQRTITDTSGPQSGFALQTVPSSGLIHRHINSELLGSDGNSTAGDGIEPAAGIYAVKIELTSSNASIATSDPFYLVYNNALEEEPHEAAMEFLAASVVPEPSSLAALAIGGMLMRRRR